MSCEHDETNCLDFSERFWRNFPATKDERKFCNKSGGSLSYDNSHDVVGGNSILSDALLDSMI